MIIGNLSDDTPSKYLFKVRQKYTRTKSIDAVQVSLMKCVPLINHINLIEMINHIKKM